MNPAKSELYKDWANVYVLIMQKIDKRIARILEYISLHNTTNINISEIARSVNLPVTTVYGVLKRLQSRGIINIRNVVNFASLGLTQYSVVFYYTKREDVEKVLRANKDYRIYFVRGYCDRPCIYAKYAIPTNNNKDFIEFLNTAVDLKLIDDYEAYATTNSYIPPVSFKNFDFKKKTWIFNWEELLNNVYAAEPSDLLNVRNQAKVKLDEIDLKILLRREVSVFVHLSSIKKVLNDTSLQSIYYHYFNHILKNDIISAARVVFSPYPYTINGKIISDSMMFFIKFSSTEWMNKFINALKDTCFLRSAVRVFGENMLLIYVYLPHVERLNFLQFLDKFTDEKIISYYRFFLIDLRTAQSESLPYQVYDTQSGEWRWTQDEYLARLKNNTELIENNEYSLFNIP